MSFRVFALVLGVGIFLPGLAHPVRGEFKTLPVQEVYGPIPPDMESTLLSIAGSVEENQSKARPEVAGLTRRVKALLAREAKPWPEDNDKLDKRTRLLGKLRLPGGSADWQPGFSSIGGFIFNAMPDAVEGEIIELKARMASGEDALPLLWRMGHLAGKIGDTSRGQNYHDKAEKLARQRLEENPGSAEAHALLADLLGWGDETCQEAEREMRRALELDSKCWRAMLVHADWLVSYALHDLLPEGKPKLGDPTVDEMHLYRRIYDHPPDAARVAAMEKSLGQAEALLQEAMQAAPNVMELRYRATGLKMASPLWRMVAKLLREQRPGSLDEFNQMRLQLSGVMGKRGLAEAVTSVFGDNLRVVAKLAPENGQLLGAVAILMSVSPIVLDGKTWDDLPASTRKFIVDADALLQKMGGSSEPGTAAKAWESATALQTAIGLFGGPHGRVGEFAARSVALDPLCITAWDFLLGALSENKRYATLRAAAEIRLAVLPTEGSHRQCAYADKETGDYADCLAHMNVILEKKPEDLQTLVWMAGTRLRQDASQKALAALDKTFDHIRDLYAAQRDSLKREVVEDLLVNLVVFLALKGQEESSLAIVRSGLEDGRLGEEAGRNLLEILRP